MILQHHGFAFIDEKGIFVTNNKVIQEKKDLKVREDQLKKELEKFKLKEENVKLKEKD